MNNVMVLLILSVTLLPSISSIPGKRIHRRHRRQDRDAIARWPPQLEIHPTRLKLFRDALGWMTFRGNGALMSAIEVESLFLNAITDRYQRSKMYHTFVIAFQRGVLPRMSLDLNYPCVPEVHYKFRDPSNSSVTWHYLKKYTFELYSSTSNQPSFCDYRRGLICNPRYKVCTCPDSAQMAPTSSEDRSRPRCLVKQDQNCSLIDMAHGDDPTHRALANNLPMMIFNPEKPLGCMPGTTCRFKANHLVTPRCYNMDSGPFHPPPSSTWTLELGAECTLGLIANPGSCQVNTGQYGQLAGLTCYNLGPSPGKDSKPTDNATGFCMPESGPSGLSKLHTSTNDQLHFHPMFLGFAHPRNVQLTDSTRPDYYKQLLDVHSKLLTLGILQETPGLSCSVVNTAIMKKLWTSYSRLEYSRPPHGYTRPESLEGNLKNRLQQAISLIERPSQKICKIYHHFYRTEPDLAPTEFPALECVRKSNVPDANGNDGICQKSRANNQETLPFSKRLQDMLDVTSAILEEQQLEDENYDPEILLANPDAACKPATDKTAGTGDVIEDGACVDGYECFEDYADIHGIYDSSCNLLPTAQQNLVHSCKEVVDGLVYGNCEGRELDKRIRTEVEWMMGNSSKLGFGETCRIDMELKIRDWLFNGGEPTINKYKLWKGLEEERKEGYPGEGAFCDVGRLLECRDDGKCGCEEDTKRRSVNVDGIDYNSDYCYLTKGSCRGDVGQFVGATQEEKKELWKHYGNPAGGADLCKEGGNLCFFLDKLHEECREGRRDPKGNSDEEEGQFVKDAAGHLEASCVITGVAIITLIR